MKISRRLNYLILGAAISVLPLQAMTLSNDKLRANEFQSQGTLQEVITKGSGQVMINNIMYKVAPYAKVRVGDKPVKLRHLDLGMYMIFIYKEGKKDTSKPDIAAKPEITAINVMIQ